MEADDIQYSGKFSWGPMTSLQSFRGLIFADASDHAHYTLYNRTYFTGLIFADSRLSAKIGPHERKIYGSINSTHSEVRASSPDTMPMHGYEDIILRGYWYETSY
jgi:hypothetical protein